MPYKRMIRIYTERKDRLNVLLNDSALGLKEERLHSIRGAVDEINLFLSVLNQHQQTFAVPTNENTISRLAVNI